MSRSRKNIGVFFMAFLVMFSTMSFSMDMHFCGKTLVDLQFFAPADTCGMGMESEDNAESLSDGMPCCSDVELIIEGQDDLQTTGADLNTASPELHLPALESCFTNIELRSQREILFEEYSPPLPEKDICILFQTFLI